MNLRPKPPAKTKLINMRVSLVDYELLVNLAASHGLSISDFIRARAGLPVRYRRPKVGKKPKSAPPLPRGAEINARGVHPPSKESLPPVVPPPEPPADLSLVSILHRR